MSDIIVIQPDENNVVVSEVINSITTASDGPQGPAGPTGATGATGATGPAGSSGVVAVTAPITNSGTSSSANIGISAGSTSAAGALQLTDSVASTSTTTAATPNAVKTAYDLATLNPILPTTSTYYTRTAIQAHNAVGASHNTVYYTPIFVPISTTFDRLAIRAAATFSGTATVRLGIYNNSNGLPSTLILDAGTVSVTAAGNFQVTISQTLSPGFYWLAMCQQGTAPTTGAYVGGPPSATYVQNYYIPMQSSPSDFFITGAIQSSVTGAFATASSSLSSAATLYVWARAA